MSIDTLLDAPMNVKDMTTEVEAKETFPFGKEVGVKQNNLDWISDGFLKDIEYYTKFRGIPSTILNSLRLGSALFGKEFVSKLDPGVEKKLTQLISENWNIIRNSEYPIRPGSMELNDLFNQLSILKTAYPETFQENDYSEVVDFLTTYISSNIHQVNDQQSTDQNNFFIYIYAEAEIGQVDSARKHMKEFIANNKTYITYRRVSSFFVSRIMMLSTDYLEENGLNTDKFLKEKLNIPDLTYSDVVAYSNAMDLAARLYERLIFTNQLKFGEDGLELIKKSDSENEIQKATPLPTTRRFGK